MAAAQVPNASGHQRTCEIEDVGVTKLQTLINEIDVLLVSTTPVEREALLLRLRPLRGEKAVLEGSIGALTMRIGHFGRYQAAHVECSMGSVGRDSSALTLADAINVIKPKAVLVLGIAFGCNRKTQSIGDIIIADYIIPYERARVGKRVVYRGQSIAAGLVLSDRFRRRHIDWSEQGEQGQVKVHCGALLSGEKLIDDRAARNALLKAFPTAIGGEMEGAGGYAAASRANVEILLIKAISDFADGKKSKTTDKQPFAASMAVSLACHVLSKPDVLAELGAHDRGLPDEPQRDVAVLSPRDQLVEGIDALPQPWAGRFQSFIDAYVGTAERPNVFCGRDEDVEQLLEWLEHDDVPPNLLVTAPAGRGKSALLVRAAMKWAACENIDVAFIPWSARYDTNRPDVFLGALIARIARLRRRNPPDLKHANAGILQKMLHEELAQPHTEGRKLVIMLDGLDESVGFDIKPGFLPPSHLDSIRVIVSARHQPDDPQGDRWIRDLGWVGPRTAERLMLAPLDIRDVETALSRLHRPLNHLSERHNIVSEIHRLCVGDPLTLWLMVIDILALGQRALALDVSELQARPPGLAGYFEDWWKHQRKQWKSNAPQREKSVHALLELLAVAEGRLTRDDVLTLLRDEIPNGVALNDTLQDLSRLIEGDGKTNGYVLAHPGFGQYWRDQIGKHACQRWQERIANWIEQVNDDFFAQRLPADALPKYAVQHRVPHLKQQRASSERWMSVATRQWYDAWQVHEQGPSGFLDDVNSAWKVIAIDGGRFADEAQCALVRGSIGSTLAQITARLLQLLLDENIWTPEQAFAYVRAAPLGNHPDSQRSSLLKVLAPHLPDSLLAQVLEMGCDLENDPIGRLDYDVLHHILKRLAITNPLKARVTLNRIESPGSRALRLKDLAMFLPEQRSSLMDEAVVLARQLERPEQRSYVLKQIAVEMPEELRESLLREAFDHALLISDANTLCATLTDFILHLPGDLQQPALAKLISNARKLPESNYLYTVEKLVIESRTPLREKALAEFDAALSTQEPSHLWGSCLRVLPHMPEDQTTYWIDRAFDNIEKINAENQRAWAISGLLQDREQWKALRKYIPMLATRALRTVSTFQDLHAKLHVLAALQQHVTPETVWSLLEPSWSAVVGHLQSEGSFDSELSLNQLLPIIPIDKALAAARQARYPWIRSEMLRMLAWQLPIEDRSAIVAEAFDAAKLASPPARADLYFYMLGVAPSPQQDEIIQALVATIDELGDPRSLASNLERLAPLLADEGRKYVLDTVRALVMENEPHHVRVMKLFDLAARETGNRREKLLDEVSTLILGETQPAQRREHLIQLARQYTGTQRRQLLRLALESTSAIGDERECARAMIAFAAYISADEVAKIVECIQSIPSTEERANTFVELLARCPAERVTQFDNAVEAARATGQETGMHGRAFWLAKLVPVATPESREPLVREVLDLTREELKAYERLPPGAHLESDHVIGVNRDTDRNAAEILDLIAWHLPEQWIPEALSMVSMIEDYHRRTETLVLVGLRLPEAERRKLADSILTQEIPLSRHHRPDDMQNFRGRTVAHLLPEPEHSEMLAKFPAPNYCGIFSNPLPLLGNLNFDPTQLDDRELDERLAEVEAEKKWSRPYDERLVRLGALAAARMRRPRPPRDKLKKLVHDTLEGRSETRADALMALSAMAPLIVELGGQEAAIGVVKAIRRVGKWWA